MVHDNTRKPESIGVYAFMGGQKNLRFSKF